MTIHKKKALLWLIIPFAVSFIGSIVAMVVFAAQALAIDEGAPLPPSLYVPFIVIGAVLLLICILGTVMGIKALVKNSHDQAETHPEHGYAGFWKRVAAAIIDAFVVFVGVVILSFLVGKVATIAAWAYFILMESSSYQATLGKMAIGIKVTDIHGNRISWKRSTGRYFAKILSGLAFYAGYIMTAFTGRKQAMHDMLADTLVVNK